MDATREYLVDLRIFRRTGDEQFGRFVKEREEEWGRKGPWSTTATGKLFWLMDPRPEDVFADDIATTLAKIPRFLGNTHGWIPYSVAQHCVIGSYHIAPNYALAFLLHDAVEAYTGDIITPVKRLFAEAYAAIEKPIQDAVDTRFGVIRNEEVQKAVKEMDLRMLATEAEWLVPGGILHENTSGVEQVMAKLDPLPWYVAREMFLQRLSELTSVPA